MSIKFHIPDFYQNWQLNLNLLYLFKERPEYFYDNIEFGSCYGCFPNAMWNGGRKMIGTISRNESKAIMLAFNDMGVPIRFTFTNPLITKIHLHDTVSNGYARQAENGFNEIICNSPELEEYVRSHYPKYPLISSTVKQIRDLDGIKAELAKDYKYVVLDYNWNNDFELLEKIPFEDRKRCEILIDAYCMPNCPRRGEHYKYLGKYQIDTSISFPKTGIEPPLDFKCKYPVGSFYDIFKYKTVIKVEELYSKYVEMGFENFKIEGRGINAFNVLESYMYYLVKPEYRDRARLEMLMMPAYRIDALVKKYVY